MRAVQTLLTFVELHQTLALVMLAAIAALSLASYLYIMGRRGWKHRVLQPLGLSIEQEQKVKVRHRHHPSMTIFVIPTDGIMDNEAVNRWADTVAPRLKKNYQVIAVDLIQEHLFRSARYKVTFGLLEALR